MSNKCQDWLDDAETYGGALVRPPCPALHVVLKMRSGELEAIRAFVERVEKRWRESWEPSWEGETAKTFRRYVQEELAAMEKEAE